jgi:hypothetical protein
MRDPGPRLDARGDLGDRAVGNAEETELRAFREQLDASLREPCGHR